MMTDLADVLESPLPSARRRNRSARVRPALMAPILRKLRRPIRSQYDCREPRRVNTKTPPKRMRRSGMTMRWDFSNARRDWPWTGGGSSSAHDANPLPRRLSAIKRPAARIPRIRGGFDRVLRQWPLTKRRGRGGRPRTVKITTARIAYIMSALGTATQGCGARFGEDEFMIVCSGRKVSVLGLRPAQASNRFGGYMVGNGTWVCFNCREAFRRPTQHKEAVPCSSCRQPRQYVGTQTRLPPKCDAKAWQKLRDRFNAAANAARERAQIHRVRGS